MSTITGLHFKGYLMFLSNEKYIIVVKCINYLKPTQNEDVFLEMKRNITFYKK